MCSFLSSAVLLSMCLLPRLDLWPWHLAELAPLSPLLCWVGGRVGWRVSKQEGRGVLSGIAQLWSAALQSIWSPHPCRVMVGYERPSGSGPGSSVLLVLSKHGGRNVAVPDRMETQIFYWVYVYQVSLSENVFATCWTITVGNFFVILLLRQISYNIHLIKSSVLRFFVLYFYNYFLCKKKKTILDNCQ